MDHGTDQDRDHRGDLPDESLGLVTRVTSRRSFLTVSIVGFGAALLAACSQPPAPAAPAAPTAPATPAPAPAAPRPPPGRAKGGGGRQPRRAPKTGGGEKAGGRGQARRGCEAGRA